MVFMKENVIQLPHVHHFAALLALVGEWRRRRGAPGAGVEAEKDDGEAQRSEKRRPGASLPVFKPIQNGKSSPTSISWAPPPCPFCSPFRFDGTVGTFVPLLPCPSCGY